LNERPPSGQRRLGIVPPEHELRGHAPLAYERLIKTCQPGSAEHRGVLTLAHALTRGALARCLPPSARSELGSALGVLESCVTGQRSYSESSARAKDARASAFSALPALEKLTKQAVVSAAQLHEAAERTSLQDHALHTMDRLLGLSVHHAVAALCHALDAIVDAEAGLAVPSDACGALAYSRTALGSVRNPTFQQAALEQAAWEHGRARGQGMPEAALAIQVFHEYVGARWRAHADEERRASDEFIAWALG
jgi:hypothetical protein